ncbi:MAG: hypothetical protein ABI882_09445 [Acidobacteriota bacterium]
MKKNLAYAAIGLTVGLVCGFKASNYNYRSELNANKMAGINSAVPAKPGAGAQPDQPSVAEVQAVVAKARREPPDFEAQHEAAHLFVQIQRPEGALEFLLKAQQLKPEDPETLADLAEVYYLSQKFDESIKWARRALVARPKLPIANYYLMASFVETNTNLGEAERILSELEEIRPGDQALAQIRNVIQQTRKEGVKGKTVIAHGPEEAVGEKR